MGCGLSKSDHDEDGSGSPLLGARAPTSQCKKINNSVYELYMPPTQNAELDIVFIHGFHTETTTVTTHLSTWKSRCKERLIWPKCWLSEDFPAARVLTTTYDASPEKDGKHGRMDLYLVAESLQKDLMLANVGETRPMILVGHSVGGIVIKQLICSLFNHSEGDEWSRKITFLQNIRGVFFYATPHQGGDFQNFVRRFKDKGELVKMVRVQNKELERLNEDFYEKFKCHIAGVFETYKTEGVTVVEEASGRCPHSISVQEDHISICQPRSKQDTTYKCLVSLVEDVQLKVKEEISKMPEDFQSLPTIRVGPLSSLTGGESSLARGEILENLEMFSVVGLWGMGGVGKTTLSKAAFNTLHHKFEYTLFVKNMKERMGDAKTFREELLQQVHCKGKKMEKISNTMTLGGKDILVVLDDVCEDRHIDIVHELQGICSSKSRYILTSRGKEILRKVDPMRILEVHYLDEKDSERLFRSFVFPCDGPWLPWQQKCSEDLVQHCQGLPLSLEVVGKYLSNSEEKVWIETLNKLRGEDNVGGGCMDTVWSRLKVSYDGLRDEEKQMFIDSATFFQENSLEGRWKLFQAKALWNVIFTSEATYWKSLVDRSLVYDVAEDSEIEMHEQLKVLGQKLAKDLTETNIRLKLNDFCGSFTKALQKRNLQPEKLHIIQLLMSSKAIKPGRCMCTILRKVPYGRWYGHPLCQHKFQRISLAKLQAMENLHYMQVKNYRLTGKKVKLPHNLLAFCNEGPGENISFRLCSKLIYLIMESSGIKRLPHSFLNLHQLQFLRLESTKLKCLPELFCSLTKLHTCWLYCPLLKNLPNSIGDLKDLHEFRVLCGRLNSLPESFGSLENLQELIIYSSKFERMPESFGSLENLRRLIIHGSKIERLPESLKSLGNSQELETDNIELKRLLESFRSMRDVRKLERIPESFESLANLPRLIVGGNKFERLPESFGSLGNLRELIINSSKFERLPESFGNLRNLRKLMIGNSKLESLPESFGNLENLQELEILKSQIESLPKSFGGLRNLKKQRIWSNKLGKLLQF